MVKFGQRLAYEAKRLPESWGDFLLDYEQLKRRLETAIEMEKSSENLPGTTSQVIAESTRNSFQHLLDSELEKMLAKYKLCLAVLVNNVDALKRETRNASRMIRDSASARLHGWAQSDDGQSVTAEDIKRLADLWVGEAKSLQNLLLFLSLNMEGLRKILKKYKKSSCHTVTPRPGLMTLRLEHQSLPGGFVEQGTFLPAAIVEEINAMKDRTELNECSQAIKAAFFELDLMKKELGQQEETRGRTSLRKSLHHMAAGRNRNRVQQSIHALRDAIDPIIISLDEAHLRAERELSVIEAIPTAFVAQAGIFTEPPPDDAAYATLPGLVMNLLSAFLYMTNYNLVLPTNEAFLNHIGSNGSMAGMIVGFSDLTAVAVSLLYGWWSNYSFKKPLIAASLLSLGGNVLYCLAWDGGRFSLALLLAGRLMTGLGSCRAVNRRYIADYVSSKRRTAASAAFVAASAGGAALGPLLAVPLSMIKPTKVLSLDVNAITAGGWLLTLAWFLYTAYIYLRFQDPTLDKDDESDDDTSEHGTSVKQVEEEGDLERPLLGGGRQAPASAPGTDMQPVYVCVLSLFALKLIQQGMISSLPEFTHQFYSWRTSFIGGFLSALSLGMLPVNFFVAFIASFVSDRKLLLWAEALSLVGLLGMLSFSGGSPNLYVYVFGAVVVYSTTIVMESCAMSLMSKKIPSSMARGTCNAGLMATQAGSFGRFMGNMMITLYGTLLGGHLNTMRQIVRFDWLMYGSLLGAGFATMAYTVAIFKRLATSASSS